MDTSRSVQRSGCTELPGGWRVERWQAPALVDHARPGQRLAAGSAELPVMRTRAATGELECLARGPAGAAVAAADADLRGEPFELSAPSPRALLIGDLSGLAPLVFLADRLRSAAVRVKTFAILGLDGEAPFRPVPSRLIVPGVPAWVTGTLPLFEDWGIAARLASAGEDRPGCFEGTPVQARTRLARSAAGRARCLRVCLRRPGAARRHPRAGSRVRSRLSGTRCRQRVLTGIR